MNEIAIASSVTLLYLLIVLYLIIKLIVSTIRLLFIKGTNGAFKSIIITSSLLAILLSALLYTVPGIVDKGLNGVLSDIQNRRQELEKESGWSSALALHNSFDFVSDLHSDAMMWSHRKSILNESSYGHVDVPRMQRGNVALQVFATVTKVPVTQNIQMNSNRTDVMTMLVSCQQWPFNSWFSLSERVIFQGRRLREAADQSNGEFTFIRSKQQLENFIQRRKSNSRLTAGLLAVEGAHALDHKLENVQRLYDAGVRMFGMAHFFDNEACGSVHGEEEYGLTEFGRKAVKKMLDLNMIIDLAHTSDKAIVDILKMTEGTDATLVVSHTGVKGTCDNKRNLSDERLKQIASRGVIGIAFFDTAICGTTIDDLVKAIRYTVDLVGAEHVALGSDFDGSVKTVVDPTHFPHLTYALLKSGLSEQQVELIMSGNVKRLLSKALPDK
jgi:membrane dipeptidase